MSLEFINLLNFTFHVLLIISKVYLIYIFYKSLNIIEAPTHNKLLVYNYLTLSVILFCFICVWSEVYFLVSFYTEADLYYYEFSALLDQIISPLLIIYYFKKGFKNG